MKQRDAVDFLHRQLWRPLELDGHFTCRHCMTHTTLLDHVSGVDEFAELHEADCRGLEALRAITAPKGLSTSERLLALQTEAQALRELLASENASPTVSRVEVLDIHAKLKSRVSELESLRKGAA